MRKFSLLVVMLFVVLGTQYMIAENRSDVVVSREELSGNPTNRYAAVGESQGTVLVAHGFAGSKQLMQHWGYALARQGFDTYIFDQPGHGEQVSKLPSWRQISGNPLGANLRAMVQELERAGRAESDKIALVGHSMGGTTVVSAALDDPSIAATVAISAAYADPLPDGKPANMLSLVAERDPASIRTVAGRLTPQSDNRRIVEVAGRNHLSILYDQAVLEEAAAWIHASLESTQPGPVGKVMDWGWIWLALAGGIGAILAMAWLLAPPEFRSLGRQQSIGFLTALVAISVAALSAVLVVIYLRTPWFGIAVLDYLLPYFLVAAAVLMTLRWLWPRDFAFSPVQGGETVFSAVFRGLGLLLVFLGAVVPVIHMNLTHFIPTSSRIWPMLAFGLVLWLYFVQEEGLKQSAAAEWGPLGRLVLGLAGKAVIMITWLGATALPNPPVFLSLTIPVTATLLVVLEVIGLVLWRMRHSAATTATLSAWVVAWAVASTFPLV